MFQAIGLAWNITSRRFLTAHYWDIAIKEVYVATAPFWTSIRKPQYPDWSVLSVTVTIQLAGSGLPVCQTLAESVEPLTLKRKEYDVPAMAVNGAVPRIVAEPFTFFCTTRLLPLI